MGENTIDEQNGLRTRLDLKHSATRQRVDDSFGKTLQRSMAAAANVVAGIAGPLMPNATAVLGAAHNGMTSLRSATAGSSVAPNAASLGGTATVATGTGVMGGVGTGGGYMGAVANRAAAGDASSQMMMATREMQELNQQFNLQYLMLQQKIQGENRQYTALSNVMKSKHDTAKNALNNLK